MKRFVKLVITGKDIPRIAWRVFRWLCRIVNVPNSSADGGGNDSPL